MTGVTERNRPPCRSEGRKAKDQAIRVKQEKRLLADLVRLRTRITSGHLKQPKKVFEALGRLKERYPRVARYWKIDYAVAQHQLAWQEDGEKKQRAVGLDGTYLLKTDRKDLTAEEAWRLYILLTRVEDAFRDMKTHASWATLRQQLNTHQVVTAVLPTTDGHLLKIRKATTPEPYHRDIYRVLDIPEEVAAPVKTWLPAEEGTSPGSPG